MRRSGNYGEMVNARVQLSSRVQLRQGLDGFRFQHLHVITGEILTADRAPVPRQPDEMI